MRHDGGLEPKNAAPHPWDVAALTLGLRLVGCAARAGGRVDPAATTA